MLSRSHAETASRPVSVPSGSPLSVLIPSKPAMTLVTEVPANPSPSEALSVALVVAAADKSSVSDPASPSMAPVSAASMSKVSSPAPPLRLKLLAEVTLKASVLVPPWRASRPLKPSVLLPSL